MAQRFGHLTASMAAGLAYEAGVNKLYLTHISRRYAASQVLAEAQVIFPNTTVVRDLDFFRLTRMTEEAGPLPPGEQEA